MPDSLSAKKLLFVQTRAPHGSINGQEGLDALLAGSAFAECAILLMDDGVLQLVRGQDTDALGTKNYAVSYGALADYGVEPIYVAGSHLARRGFVEDDLEVPVAVIDDDAIADLMANHDVILTF